MNAKLPLVGASTGAEEPLSCGLVMPISGIDGCTAEHWAEVKAIVQDAVENIQTPRFIARLVSDADDVGVIQKRIIHGVYSSDVLVCDVSAKNPNVMFELGLRLAFDKPTVIIKDDKTDYAFDTSVIEHLTYPRDLRFSRMVEFKKLLAQKVLATYNAAQVDPDHSTFLKSFGTFKVAQLHEKEASAEQVILDSMAELQKEVGSLRRFVMGRPNRIVTSMSRRRDEGMERLVDALQSLQKSDPDLALDASDELLTRLAGAFDAPTYFPTLREFRDAVQDACKIVG